MPRDPIVTIETDADALARLVADWLIERIGASTGSFALNLSGGSTPKRLYSLLACPTHRDRIPWTRLHLFFGDERFVPPDDPENNFGMVRDTLIAHVPIPPTQVHAVPTVGVPDAQAAAAAYQHTLERFYGSEQLDASRPLFDVTFLGVGPDGHTASLFPGTVALDESAAWVVPVIGPTPPYQRITLTYPALASSHVIAFLVTGHEKCKIVKRVLDGDRTLPAARVQNAGELRWFLDRAAAANDGA